MDGIGCDIFCKVDISPLQLWHIEGRVEIIREKNGFAALVKPCKDDSRKKTDTAGYSWVGLRWENPEIKWSINRFFLRLFGFYSNDLGHTPESLGEGHRDGFVPQIFQPHVRMRL